MNDHLTRDQTPAPVHSTSIEMKLRKIFIGCLILCTLIVGHLFYVLSGAGRSTTLIRFSLLPILMWTGVVTGYAFHALWKISEQRRLQLAEAARRDSLTAAYTAAYMEELLAQHREEVYESGQSATFCRISFSGVEKVNNDYGHAAGDIVLKDLVGIVVQCLPPRTPVARLAGMEFCALLAGTRPRQARSLVGGIPARVRAYELDLAQRGRIGGLDALLGLAAFPGGGEDLQAIAQAARRATPPTPSAPPPATR